MADWTDLAAAFAYGTKLTSQQMQQLRDNITAVTENASGAPEIVNGALADIANSKLKSSTGNANGSTSATSYTNIQLQDYCFFPNIYTDTGHSTSWINGYNSNESGTTARFAIYNDDSGSRNYDVDYRYLTATLEGFIFALFDANGDVKHLWLCEDDPPAGFPSKDPIAEYDDKGKIKPLQKAYQAKADKLMVKEIIDKSKADKKFGYELMTSDYEFDSKSKLFKKKNIGMI